MAIKVKDEIEEFLEEQELSMHFVCNRCLKQKPLVKYDLFQYDEVNDMCIDCSAEAMEKLHEEWMW